MTANPNRNEIIIQEIINGSPGDYERYQIASSDYARERFDELKKYWAGRKFILVERTTSDKIIAE